MILIQTSFSNSEKLRILIFSKKKITPGLEYPRVFYIYSFKSRISIKQMWAPQESDVTVSEH